MERILEMIESGMSQAQIAREFNVSQPSLNAYLNNETYVDRSAHARQLSAESWLDKGLQAVEAAMLKASPYDVQAARAYAQECARRAAIRNPQYREHTKVEHSGSVSKTDALTEDELRAVLEAKTTHTSK
jgi:transcriptional regulator with XRE-family HTH domain